MVHPYLTHMALGEMNPSNEQWTERAQRETVAAREVRRQESPERAAAANAPEQTEDERLEEFVATLTPERLRAEEARLEDFIKAFQKDLGDLMDLAPESTALAQELVAGDMKMLQAIQLQRGRLGDGRMEIPRAPKVAAEYAQTMRPEEFTEAQKGSSATVPPPARRKRPAQDISNAPTEFPKSDLPN